MTASKPAAFIAGPNEPPELASPQVPVFGLFPTTMYRFPVIAVVPVSSPVKKPRWLSGPSGSTPGFWSL